MQRSGRIADSPAQAGPSNLISRRDCCADDRTLRCPAASCADGYRYSLLHRSQQDTARPRHHAQQSRRISNSRLERLRGRRISYTAPTLCIRHPVCAPSRALSRETVMFARTHDDFRETHMDARWCFRATPRIVFQQSISIQNDQPGESWTQISQT